MGNRFCVRKSFHVVGLVIEGVILSRICGIQFEGGLPVYWNSDFFTVGGLVHLRKSEYKVLRNILKKNEWVQFFCMGLIYYFHDSP